MKIKEAAQYCGLTEKAIRLYEAKGLIRPSTEEKNGRTYREYDEETIRTLLTVGTLRRADFTMEQIGLMQADPDKIPQVFAEYRTEIHENAARLTALDQALSQMDAGELHDLDRFAAHLADAMVPQGLTTSSADEGAAVSPTVVHFRQSVWDEELSAEEKEEAYRKFIKKQERRDRLSDVMLAFPRKIGGGFRWLKDRVDPIIRDGQGKVKKSAKTFLVFVCVGAVLSAGLTSAVGKLRQIEDNCAYEIYISMHDAVYALRNAVTTGSYTYGHSEVVCRNLALIHGYVKTADDVYYHAFNQLSRRYDEIDGLVRAMGCTYTGTVNSERAEAILYDGVLSENEMQFIELLYADLSEVYAIMLAEDGLNRREDLDYDMIHDAIHGFLDKWGEWRDMNYDTPYRLLMK